MPSPWKQPGGELAWVWSCVKRSEIMWHGQACHTYPRWNSDQVSAAAKTDWTHLTNSLTMRMLQSSNQTIIIPDNINSKCNWETLRKAVIRHATSSHLSLNLWNTLLVILIIPIIPTILVPGIQHQARPICPVQAAVPTDPQWCGFQRKSMKVEWQTANAPAPALETAQSTSVPNIPSQTDLTRTPAKTVTITTNNLSAKSYLIRCSKPIGRFLWISNSAEEAAQCRVRIAGLGKPSLIRNLGWNTTTPYSIKIKRHSWRLGSDVKPISTLYGETTLNT